LFRDFPVDELASFSTRTDGEGPTLPNTFHSRGVCGGPKKKKTNLGLLGLGVDVSTLAEEKGDHFLVAFSGSLHERRVALVIDLLDVGATLE
jgi:hypothetical protein